MSTSPHLTRKMLWAALAWTGFALALRLLVLLQSRDVPALAVPLGDAWAFDRAGQALAAGEASHLWLWRSPLYALWLGLVYACNDGWWLPRLAQALAGAITCGLTFQLARQWMRPALAGGAALLVAASGPLIFYETQLLPTTWSALLGVLLAWLGRDLGQPASGRRGLLWGALAALGSWLHLAFLPVLAGALVVALRTPKGPERQRLVRALLAGAALVLLLFAGLSYRLAGKVQLLPAATGLDAYLTLHPSGCALRQGSVREMWQTLDAWPARVTPAAPAAPAAPKLSSPASPTSAPTTTVWPAQPWGRELMAWARAQPLAGIRSLSTALGELLSAREVAPLGGLRQRSHDVWLLRWLLFAVGPWGFPSGLLLPLGLLGLVLGWRQPGVRSLATVLLPYALTLLCLGASADTRTALVPLWAISAAWTVSYAMTAWRAQPRAQSAKLVGALVGIVLITGLTTVPGPFCAESKDPQVALAEDLGRYYEDQGDRATAVIHYQQVLERNKDVLAVHRRLGKIFAADGEIDGAIAHYGSAIRIAPRSAPDHSALAELLLQQGKTDQALIHLETLVALEPTASAAHRRLGQTLLALGQSERALAVLREAVRLAPNDAETQFILGGLLLKQGDAVAARDALLAALAQQPRAPIHNELGTAYLALNQLPAAVEQFQRAIALDPDYVDAYSNAGVTSALLGRLAEAGEFLSQAIQRRPDHVDARYNLGWVLLRLGEQQQAIEQFQEVLKRRPDHPLASRQLQTLGVR